MAQQFILKGHHIEVKYTTGITPGLIALTYKDGTVSHDFKTDEIATEKTRLGFLVSIALLKSVDIGGTNFGFFLPDVPTDQALDFTTTAIREEFSGPNSVPHRPTIWHCLPMHGTVKSVIGPL
jgi:hypothetical protein